MNFIKLISLLPVCFLIYSCGTESDNGSESVNESWCKNLVYGEYEATTKDGVKVKVAFKESEDGFGALYNEGFYMSYQFGDEKYIDGYPYAKSIHLIGIKTGFSFNNLFEFSSDSVKLGQAIKLLPEGLGIFDGEGGGYEVFSDEETIPNLKLTYVSGNEIKLEFTEAKKLIQKHFNLNVSDEVNTISLKKISGAEVCFNFNPNVSYDKFSQNEQGFIYHDLDVENWSLAEKDLMLDYSFNRTYNDWDRSLEKFGSVFKLDFNQDGEDDIAGYFTHNYDDDKKLVFKIFLNNGVSYDEAFSKNISDYEGGWEIYFPDKLNGKDVIGCSMIDKGGYCLFFNKLTGKIEQKFYD